MMPSSGFFPVPSSTSTTAKPATSCENCKRLTGIFEQMRDLPLSQRVSYVYMGLINEALEGGK